MKTLKTAASLASFAACLSIFSTSVALARGGADIGGGNGSPAKIIRITAAGLDSLSGRSLVIRDRKIDIAAMQAALAGLQEIRPTSEQLAPVNGKPVCLVNHPEAKMLEMNVPCFDSYDEDTKLQMGFHETWGLAFHDGADDTYYFSAKMVEALKNAPASQSATVIVRVPGFALKILSPEEYKKDAANIDRQAREKSEMDAVNNCTLRDGVARSQPSSVVDGRSTSGAFPIYSLQAEATVACEVIRVKKLPLLGIQTFLEDLSSMPVTNFTVAGRQALLANTQDPKAQSYLSRDCLNQAVQNSKDIAQDKDLQKLKAEIEEKIGAFALAYDLHSGFEAPGPNGDPVYPPHTIEGSLSVYTFDPALLQTRDGVTIDFNKMWAAMINEMYLKNGKKISGRSPVNCQVSKDSVKKYLTLLKAYLTTDEESLSTDDDN